MAGYRDTWSRSLPGESEINPTSPYCDPGTGCGQEIDQFNQIPRDMQSKPNFQALYGSSNTYGTSYSHLQNCSFSPDSRYDLQKEHPGRSKDEKTRGIPDFVFKGDAEDARMWRDRVTMGPYIPPCDDPSIGQIKSESTRHIKEMMMAMWNQKGCHDKDKSPDRAKFTRGGPKCAATVDVEATCTLIFEALIFRCERGYRGPEKDNLALKPSEGREDDQTGDCRQRLDNVIHALSTSKCICRDTLYSDEYIMRLVNAPLSCRAQKDDHKRNNELKEKAHIERRETQAKALKNRPSSKTVAPTARDERKPANTRTRRSYRARRAQSAVEELSSVRNEHSHYQIPDAHSPPAKFEYDEVSGIYEYHHGSTIHLNSPPFNGPTLPAASSRSYFVGNAGSASPALDTSHPKVPLHGAGDASSAFNTPLLQPFSENMGVTDSPYQTNDDPFANTATPDLDYSAYSVQDDNFSPNVEQHLPYNQYHSTLDDTPFPFPDSSDQALLSRLMEYATPQAHDTWTDFDLQSQVLGATEADPIWLIREPLGQGLETNNLQSDYISEEPVPQNLVAQEVIEPWRLTKRPREDSVFSDWSGAKRQRLSRE